ncbi:hypothetical protein [Enemella evansiae]|uniref:hypothetical protein n=2 Tax=Enemella evansiae TaxID=2016499 RepID=UPI001181732C|nr:hypothetical protein [Enemella evansiae]
MSNPVAAPPPVSAVPARRTSEDPDTNRILAEVGETITRMAVYPDRVYVTTTGRRDDLMSDGGPFVPVTTAPIPPIFGPAFPADSFLVGTVRRLLRDLGGDFAGIGRPNDQNVVDVKKGVFSQERTIRCVLPPDRVVPAFDYQSERGLSDGLAELAGVQRSATFTVTLSHDSLQGTVLMWEGRAEDQNLLWVRDQFRPLLRAPVISPISTEAFDPARVTAGVLYRVGDALTQRAGDLIGMDIRALSRNGKPKIEFTATPEDGPSLVGDADLNGRIVKIQ